MGTRIPAVLLVLGLQFAPVAAGQVEGEGTTPAVALYRPGVETPLEAAGTGLSPEVTLKAQVDARGVVTQVRILKIEPSGEHDDIFIAAVQETVSRWRYAPARKNGVAVPAEISWSVRFRELSGDLRSNDEPRGFRFTGVRTRGREAAQLRILSLPTQQRLDMLAEESNLAISFLDPKTRGKVNSRRFTVFSDAPTSEIGEIVAGNLESIFNILDGMLGTRIDPQPEKYRVIVVLFDSKERFEDYKKSSNSLEWASGFYHPAGLIAMHREVPTGERVLHTLLHEGTHAYLDRHVVRPGFRLPKWLNEGFAEYIGNSRIKKKQLVPGKTIHAQIYDTPFGMMQGDSEQHMTLDRVKATARKGEAFTVSELMEADMERFYGEKRSLYYPMSWLMVHFLQHGREEWGREQFAEFMLYVAEGYPAVEALAAVYGDEPAVLDDEFQRYVRKF